MVEAGGVGILSLIDTAQLIDFNKRKNDKTSEFAKVRYTAGTWDFERVAGCEATRYCEPLK
jgi:hypothetical protein